MVARGPEIRSLIRPKGQWWFIVPLFRPKILGGRVALGGVRFPFSHPFFVLFVAGCHRIIFHDSGRPTGKISGCLAFERQRQWKTQAVKTRKCFFYSKKNPKLLFLRKTSLKLKSISGGSTCVVQNFRPFKAFSNPTWIKSRFFVSIFGSKVAI